MVTVLILESCAGADVSYGVNSIVDLPNNEAEILIKGGIAKLANKGASVEQIKREVYPIAEKLNYGKAIDNSIQR